MRERILAVIVTFNPDCDMLKEALNTLQQQGCQSLIVDNGSENVADIESSIGDPRSSALLPQQQNLGLGAAHNIGMQYAKEHDYDYVLIMDQDSVPLPDMVVNLERAHNVKSKHSKVSAVGASYLNSQNGSGSFFVRFGTFKFSRHYCSEQDADGCIEADFLISSGSLISIKAIDNIGDMDEDFFIDHVDTEWFLRAKSKGYQAYGVCDAVMKHGLGENTHKVSLGGRQRNVPQHKPFRYYYIFRNSIILYKRGYAATLWKWNDLQRLAMIMVMFGFVKAPRWANLSMILKGVWHGLLGKQGPLDKEREAHNGEC